MPSSAHEHIGSLPQHVGIIMDGNGRWATQRSLPRNAGHWEGLKATKRVTLEASRMQLPYVTFYVFSTENWRRSEQEVSYLMNLIATRLYGELDLYTRNNIRLLVRGDISALSPEARRAVEASVEATASFTGTTVILAVNHGGQDEIVRTVNRWLAVRDAEDLCTKEIMRQYCDLPEIPPVDLIIRPGAEKRLSNFLLWDAAYAELLFYDTLWPEWKGSHLREALTEYSRRIRRFGGEKG